MKVLKLIALFTALFNLFGCSPKEPFMVDGPGMVYVDRDYRTSYANMLSPNDDEYDLWSEHSCAVAYLGKGGEGKQNRDVYIKKLFASLPEEEINQMEHFDFEGDDWFLVVPRYNNEMYIRKPDTEYKMYEGEYETEGMPFTVKGNAKLFSRCMFDVDFVLEVDEDGKLTMEDAWDITDIDSLFNYR